MRAGRSEVESPHRPPRTMTANPHSETAAGSRCGCGQFAVRGHSRLAAQLLPIRVAAADSHRAATPQPRSRTHNAKRSADFSPKYPMDLPSSTYWASSRMHFAWSELSFGPRPTSQQDTSVIFAHFFLLEAPSSTNTRPNFRQRPIAPRHAASARSHTAAPPRRRPASTHYAHQPPAEPPPKKQRTLSAQRTPSGETKKPGPALRRPRLRMSRGAENGALPGYYPRQYSTCLGLAASSCASSSISPYLSTCAWQCFTHVGSASPAARRAAH